jgi:hypothetical protein
MVATPVASSFHFSFFLFSGRTIFGVDCRVAAHYTSKTRLRFQLEKCRVI